MALSRLVNLSRSRLHWWRSSASVEGPSVVTFFPCFGVVLGSQKQEPKSRHFVLNIFKKNPSIKTRAYTSALSDRIIEKWRDKKPVTERQSAGVVRTDATDIIILLQVENRICRSNSQNSARVLSSQFYPVLKFGIHKLEWFCFTVFSQNGLTCNKEFIIFLAFSQRQAACLLWRELHHEVSMACKKRMIWKQ